MEEEKDNINIKLKIVPKLYYLLLDIYIYSIS